MIKKTALRINRKFEAMATIFCSNKLREFLGSTFFTAGEVSESNRYGDWNAHLFYQSGKKGLLVMNNKSYYAVFLEEVRKADFKHLDELFFNRLLNQMLFDKVIQLEEVPETIAKWQPLQLARTNNDKKALGTMNDFLYQYRAHKEAALYDQRHLLQINHFINGTPTGAARQGYANYGKPIEDMKNLLKTP